MSLFLAYMLMVAAEVPATPRHCGDLCRLATRPLSDMPSVTTTSAPHPEKAFDEYFACAAQSIDRSSLSAGSTDGDIDDALLAIERSCMATRQAGTAALATMVVASGARNPPAEIARFADIVRELLGVASLSSDLRRKVGDGTAREYLQGLNIESAPILVDMGSSRH